MSRISHVMGTQALKMYLGISGRADFYTAWDGWAGDIIYTDEKIVVFVLPCVFYGCNSHQDDYRDLFGDLIAANLARMDRIRNAMDEAGWTMIEFYECEVTRDPRSAAEEVVAALEAAKNITGRYATAREDVDLANLARIDFASRVKGGDTAWRSLIRTVSEMRTPITKSELKYIMIRHHKWTSAAFELRWKCLTHHEVLNPPSKGPLLNAAMMDCGFKTRGESKPNVIQLKADRPGIK